MVYNVFEIDIDVEIILPREMMWVTVKTKRYKTSICMLSICRNEGV